MLWHNFWLFFAAANSPRRDLIPPWWPLSHWPVVGGLGWLRSFVVVYVLPAHMHGGKKNFCKKQFWFPIYNSVCKTNLQSILQYNCNLCQPTQLWVRVDNQWIFFDFAGIKSSDNVLICKTLFLLTWKLWIHYELQKACVFLPKILVILVSTLQHTKVH